MNEVELVKELEGDLQRAPTVIYLEGKEDVPIFFGLLGIPKPLDNLHHGVLVRGLTTTSGQGCRSVRMRVEIAAKRRYRGIHGIVDGDGEALATLAVTFDRPHAGPLFTWKAYCIENLLVRTGWPAAWVNAPDWTEALLAHSPYVALNRLGLRLREALTTLRLARYTRPVLEEPMETVEGVSAALRRDKLLLQDVDVEQMFRDEVASFEAAVRAGLDEAHALLNGKWLVDVFAPRSSCVLNPARCREVWIAHAREQGGLPEVRALWERITGREP